jgi:hypothetical protein
MSHRGGSWRSLPAGVSEPSTASRPKLGVLAGLSVPLAAGPILAHMSGDAGGGDRSYTIDISGHGLKAIRHIDASEAFDGGHIGRRTEDHASSVRPRSPWAVPAGE